MTNNVTVQAGVHIVCRLCYLKGVATGELSVADNFSVTNIVTNITEQFEGDVYNLTKAADKYLKEFLDDVWKGWWEGSLEPVELPTFNYSFSLDVPPIPATNLRFTFDGLELYMLVDTILSLGSTYTIPLFNSAIDQPEIPIGFYITEKIKIGLIFRVDLILSVEGEIDISSGFHLKFNDGFAIDIALFGNDVSGVT